MKLIICHTVEKKLKKVKITIVDFLKFLETTEPGSKKFIEICAPLENTKVYKAYLDSLTRSVIFIIESKGLVYPVYVGNKNDAIAKNITIDLVRKNAEKWQSQFLKDIKNKNYIIRHYRKKS